MESLDQELRRQQLAQEERSLVEMLTRLEYGAAVSVVERIIRERDAARRGEPA